MVAQRVQLIMNDLIMLITGVETVNGSGAITAYGCVIDCVGWIAFLTDHNVTKSTFEFADIINTSRDHTRNEHKRVKMCRFTTLIALETCLTMTINLWANMT